MATELKSNLYSLLHEVSITMNRGPRYWMTERPSQIRVLRLLSNDGGHMRQKDLLLKMGIRAASPSQLLSKLEEDDCIERSRIHEDGNELMVDITVKGCLCAMRNLESERERDEKLFGCLQEQDCADLTRILGKLLNTWREADSEELALLPKSRAQLQTV